MLLNKILEFSCAFSPDLDKLTSSLCCRILACTFSAIIGVVFVVLTTTISTIPLTSTIVVVIITPFISLPLREFAYIHKLLKKNNILVIVVLFGFSKIFIDFRNISEEFLFKTNFEKTFLKLE